MSLVPSEFDYEDDSNSDRASMRVSGLTISLLMSVLASGFAVVGFLAFQQLPAGAPAHAGSVSAPAEEEQTVLADVGSSSPPQEAPVEIETAEEETTPPPPDDDLSEPAEPAPPEPSDVRVAAVELAPDGPSEQTTQPPEGRTPTVVFDPTIIDAESLPPGETGDEPVDAPETDPPAPVVDAPAVIDEPAVEFNVSDASDPPTMADDVDAIPAETATEPPPASAAPTDDQSTPPAHAPGAPVDALSGSHVVQVGSFRSEAEAMADWGRIERQFEDLLRGKTYNVQSADLGERGVFHRLRIGPFESSDAAQAYCRTLTERGKPCLAVRH